MSIYNSIVRYEPGTLLYYIIAKKYGRRYLNDYEFRRISTKANRDYYKMLASSLFKGRGSRFWQYHAKGVELAGDRLNWGRVLRMQLPRLINLMGNPKRTLEGFWDRFRSLNLFRRTTSVN